MDLKKKKSYTYTKIHQHEISKHWAKRILKAFRKEKEKQQQVSYKGLGVIMAPTFSIAILGAKRHWDNHFKIPRENNVQLQILCPNYHNQMQRQN